MKNDNPERDCSCWQVRLPERTPDFAAACACGESCDCRARRRVRATCAGLAVCVIIGVVSGLWLAHTDDSGRLASLRRLYLERVAGAGDGR